MIKGTPIGVRDATGREIRCGDVVRYRLAGKHTKPEYWNPEYEVIYDAPAFTLRHVGGGKCGGSLGFKLRHGGGNRDLRIIHPYKGWNRLRIIRLLRGAQA